MKKKLIIICLIYCFLFGVNHLAQADSLLVKDLELGIDSLLGDYKTSSFKAGYIIQIETDLIYIASQDSNKLEIGDRLAVTRTATTVTNPFTNFSFIAPQFKVTEAEIIAVKDEIIIAKTDSFKQNSQPQIADAVYKKAERLNIGLIDFKYQDLATEIYQEVETEVYNYLRNNENFILNDDPKIAEMVATQKIDILSRGQLELLQEEFALDMIISGEIYQDNKQVYIYIKLFDFINQETKREILEVAKSDQLIKYHTIRFAQENIYRKLFTSQVFDFKGYNLAFADLNGNQQQDLVINTADNFKVLGYNQNSIWQKWQIEDYQLGQFDDYQFIVLNQEGQDKLVAEKRNNLMLYSWADDRYQEERLDNFFRNRPRGVVNLAEKEYLLTRDYRHRLNFNYLNGSRYRVDFSLNLAPDEGYRVAVADLDNNQSKDLILTAYDGDNSFEILVYDLDLELKYKFPHLYGPILLTADLGQDGKQELFTITESRDQIVSFINQEGEYIKSWQSEKKDGEIKDLAVVDWNGDGSKELVALLQVGEQSQIIIYQVNPYLGN